MVVLAAALAAAVGGIAVARPLTRRIARLGRAAERVGDATDYASAAQPPVDELGELSASLDRAHARIRADAATLEQRQADLRRHLDDVTHDLRTPIASLLLALEQATDQASTPEQRALLHGALKDTVYLSALTANLRLATQLREGWSPVGRGEPIDLAATVERVAARARIVARRSGIALDVAVPDGAVRVVCDPVAAEQAIGNVVDNAVAYGDEGGHVAVVLEREGGAFALRVEDDGPGVRESEIPRLGTRTFRSDEARARDPRGSGLGLAITTEVCERCGWTLAFDRGRVRGLVVTVRGPVSP
jgi:signal transduction histidine kinase